MLEFIGVSLAGVVGHCGCPTPPYGLIDLTSTTEAFLVYSCSISNTDVSFPYNLSSSIFFNGTNCCLQRDKPILPICIWHGFQQQNMPFENRLGRSFAWLGLRSTLIRKFPLCETNFTTLDFQGSWDYCLLFWWMIFLASFPCFQDFLEKE